YCRVETHYFFHTDSNIEFRANPVQAVSPNSTLSLKLWKNSTYDPATGTVNLGEFVTDIPFAAGGFSAALPLAAGHYYFQTITTATVTTDAPGAGATGSTSAIVSFMLAVPEPQVTGIM